MKRTIIAEQTKSQQNNDKNITKITKNLKKGEKNQNKTCYN